MTTISFAVLVTFAFFICFSAETDIERMTLADAENDVPMNARTGHYTDYGVLATDIVRVDLYYEAFCSGCKDFDTGSFKEAIQKFGNRLDVHTYPFGNAQIIKNKDGSISFECQHGPDECYGNKLHCCALDKIPDKNKALLFNSCMMENTQSNKGSDDQAADRCARNMKIDPEPIKTCAKGSRGTQLLKSYGEESRKAKYFYVPYILVNGRESSPNTFIQDICNAFTKKPPQCLNSP